jgi:hypothetical protein
MLTALQALVLTEVTDATAAKRLVLKMRTSVEWAVSPCKSIVESSKPGTLLKDAEGCCGVSKTWHKPGNALAVSMTKTKLSLLP